ncbi:MAG TPA: glycosyltransferase family 87 protein, partial [Patescibacteria group bacterium]|nr:glycosyltransferase family 87 protein [Patescibacteria group bacterium]
MFGQADFTVFYVATQYGIHGQNLYDNPALTNSILETRGSKGSVRYLYAPIVLLLFIPLTLLPYHAAVIIWLVLNVIFLALLLWYTQFFVKKKFTIKQWCFIVYILTFYSPLFFSFRTGQLNIFLTLLFIVHLIYIKKKQMVLASILLACMIVIKVFPVILLLYYLCKKQFKVVVWSSGIVVLLLVLSIPLFGTHNTK